MFSSSDHAFNSLLFFLLLLFLPTQLGRHFWLPFSSVHGLRIDYLSPTLYVTDLLLLGLLVSLLLARFLSPSKKPISLRPLPPFFSFLFSARYYFLALLCGICANVYFSPFPLLALYGWLKVCELLFFAWVVRAYLTNKQTPNDVSYFFLAGVFLQAVLALLQYVHGGSLGGLWYFLGERTFTGDTPGIANASIFGQLILRPYGTLPHPNVLAAFLVVGIYLLLFMLPTKTVKEKMLSFGFSTFFFIALLLTLSRSALLLIPVFITVYFLTHFSKRLTLLFLTVSTFCLLSVYPIVGERFSSLSLTDETILRRTFFFQTSLEIIRTHPLFGVGLYNFIPSLGSLFPTLRYDYLQPVHSFFLMSFSEIGVPATLLLLFFGARVSYSLYHRAQYASLGLLGVVLYLGLTDHYLWTLQQGQLLFVFCLTYLFNSSFTPFTPPALQVLKAKERKI